MTIRSLTFGIVCGTTAALVSLTAGSGVLLAFAVYSLAGSLGLVGMAMSGQAGY